MSPLSVKIFRNTSGEMFSDISSGADFTTWQAMNPALVIIGTQFLINPSNIYETYMYVTYVDKV